MEKGFIKNDIRKIINIANIITSIRILCSIVLLFCSTLSKTFYSLYLIAGFSDIIDGAIARKTNTASDFGSKLDTFADFIFVTVCMIKLIPIMNIPFWLYIWIIIIAIIKFINVAYGYILWKEPVAIHSIMNKITGLLLFIFPLILPFIEMKYCAIVICVIATIAAIQEGTIIKYKMRVVGIKK